MRWIAIGFRRFADFRGRSRRREFWIWLLFAWLASIALTMADHALGRTIDDAPFFMRRGLLSGLFPVIVLVPTLALTVRRLHDMNRRWVWMLLPFGAVTLVAVVLTPLTVAGEEQPALGFLMAALVFGASLWLLVLLCLSGTPGPNRFGPDPKHTADAVDLAEVFR